MPRFSHSPGPKDIDAGGSSSQILIAHHKIHEGQYFTCGYIWDFVADDASAEMLIATGAAEMHAIFEGAVGGDAYGYFFEDTTVSANGTGLTTLNHNRTSSNTADSSIYRDPTVTSDGTQLLQEYLPGGTGRRNSIGSAGGSRVEMILKSNTNYLMRLTNKAGSSQPISMMVSWYEVEE